MTAIAIFVKTPGLSPIKTRLAAEIGTELAETWHHLAALAVAEVAQAAKIGPVYFAVAEPGGVEHADWQSLPCLIQPEGDLGHRMERILEHCVKQHGRALLLGADSPQIEPDSLKQADQWLADPEPRLVIGPAHDGGFWTFGANRALGLGSISSITYSQPETSEMFEKTLEGRGNWLRLDTLSDVDTLTTLRQTQCLMQNKKGLLPKQQALVGWVDTLAF